MPAAAVTPALIAYIYIVAFKKLVVEVKGGTEHFLLGSLSP